MGLHLLAGLLVNALATLVLAHGAWWSLLSALAIPGLHRVRLPNSGPVSFAVIVPAHNEEAGIAASLESLLRAPFTPQPRVIVVADNCDDATASVARRFGVEVVERHDDVRRGKGYALDFGLRHLRDSGLEPPGVVVFVDADTEVDENFFRALSHHFVHSRRPAQAYYRAAPGESNLGTLRDVAFRLLHWSRPLGAARIGLPTTVKGNGMAICWADVSNGLGVQSITEDAEMSLAFAARGLHFAFVPFAVVSGRMAQTYHEARTQDERWEAGRFSLQRRAAGIGLKRLIKGDLRGSAVAFEISSLPLSLLALTSTALVVTSLGLGLGSPALAIAAAASLGTYLALGGVAARLGLKEMLAFVSVPRFVLHKAGIYLRIAARRGPGEWKRTTR